MLKLLTHILTRERLSIFFGVEGTLSIRLDFFHLPQFKGIKGGSSVLCVSESPVVRSYIYRKSTAGRTMRTNISSSVSGSAHLHQEGSVCTHTKKFLKNAPLSIFFSLSLLFSPATVDPRFFFITGEVFENFFLLFTSNYYEKEFNLYHGSLNNV